MFLVLPEVLLCAAINEVGPPFGDAQQGFVFSCVLLSYVRHERGRPIFSAMLVVEEHVDADSRFFF